MKKIAVVFPAYNEEQSIGDVINEVPKKELESQGYNVEIFIIDNNSTDRTSIIAKNYNATVIFEPNQGKGNAIKTAFKQINADYLFMLDADFTYPPKYIPDMLHKLQVNDVVIGSRLKGSCEKGSFTLLTYVGNFIISIMATLIYHRKISDICSGFWGFRGHVVKELNIDTSQFEIEAKMFCLAIKKGYSIGELPIDYRRRIGGTTKLRPIRDGLKIIATLLQNRFTN